MSINKLLAATAAVVLASPVVAHSGHGPDSSVMAHIGDSFTHLTTWLAIAAVVGVLVYLKKRRQ